MAILKKNRKNANEGKYLKTHMQFLAWLLYKILLYLVEISALCKKAMQIQQWYVV